MRKLIESIKDSQVDQDKSNDGTKKLLEKKSFYDDAKCSQGKACLMICKEKTCQKNAIICVDKKCQCYQNHQNCDLLEPERFTKMIVRKIQPMDKLISQYDSTIDSAISWISNQRQITLEKLKYYGLSQIERQFIRSIEKENFSSLKGQAIAKILDNMEIKTEKVILQQKQQQIKDYWNERKIEIINIFKHLQILIDAEPLKLVKSSYFANSDRVICSNIIENKNEIEVLRTFFDKKIIKNLKLKYRASQNKFSLEKYFRICEKSQNTLILIQSDKNIKIGGFTSGNLCKKLTNAALQYSKDSFIFSLTDEDKYSRKAQANRLPNNGQINDNIFNQLPGISVGQTQGQDLLISDQANRNNTSYFKANFTKQKQKKGNVFNKSSLNNFSIDEWEAFEVIFYTKQQLQVIESKNS